MAICRLAVIIRSGPFSKPRETGTLLTRMEARGVEIGDEHAMRPLRVVLADDHDLFRVGLAAALGAHDDVEIVGQASGGRMAVRLATELRPDVVLMDLWMPDINGLHATRELIKRDPSARVVMLTVAAAEGDVAAAVAAGAVGYLVKDSPIDDVLAAVRAAALGNAWLSPRAAYALLHRVRRDYNQRAVEPDAAEDQLSPRELEVLELIARGLDNNEIAAQLSISPRTAKNHVSSILGKLGITNRIQAAVYAYRRGLV
jgi:NarL family two-component system response regulator LiaR